MDIAIIISITSLIISIITLWLTELRGPDISLVDTPTFLAQDKNFSNTYDLRNIQDTPRYFRLTVPFVYANYGKKSGTIYNVELTFMPNPSFKKYFHRFTYNFGSTSLPSIITDGDNFLLTGDLLLETHEWKKHALTEELHPEMVVESAVDKAIENSKIQYEEFIEYL
jgi:hypothetical protein